MSVETEWIRYGENGEYSGYMARMADVGEPLPSVIVLQEIWGVDGHIQDVTRRLAKAGYVAFAPDLFSKDGERLPGFEQDRIEQAKQFRNTIKPAQWADPKQRSAALSGLPVHQREQIERTLAGIFNVGGMLPELTRQVVSTSAWLKETYEYSYGKGVASVGFCLGGTLSGQLAVRDPGLRGAVIFYGNAPSPEQLPEIQCPVSGFYGELDLRITAAVPEFAQAANEADVDFDYHIYDGAQHAFFNDTRPSYHVNAARDAFARTLLFLQRVLTDSPES
ncbi:dienelactone hydrolase family protein [Paenibacillus nasutitermitis]|uniref:Carboxymethylenebutenolidase n=1 Tax=Paenibacillus nasutitermitis TaxID=1652958 RepID=A0A916Z0L3_9BACL|nr:dienelactone hydrolase family protein [Paenibacillus nasutitermitis]GGD70546.1 carboxymethylenebutenolidase [Paenibacillus nasutitermitis]